MATIASYSVADVHLTVNGLLITEFADGDAITAALTDDDTVAVQGAGGAVTFGYKHNKIVEVTFNVLQGSADLDVLYTQAKNILDARRGSVSLNIADGRGNSLVEIPQAIPKKRPDVPFATEPGTIEFVWHGPAETFKIGGNEAA